jgi:hypothetical protein
MNSIRPKQRRLRLGTEAYRQLRQRVLERDGWRCQGCGSMQHLQAHHKQFSESLGRSHGRKPDYALRRLSQTRSCETEWPLAVDKNGGPRHNLNDQILPRGNLRQSSAVLIFFIARLLYLLRFDHVDNLGAYSIPSGDRPSYPIWLHQQSRLHQLSPTLIPVHGKPRKQFELRMQDRNAANLLNLLGIV